MRFIPALALAATVLHYGVSSVGAQEKLVNEIGNVTIEGNSKVDMFRPEKDQQTITRNFQKQPPLIPHSVKGYVITQNFNKCMDCHSKERAEETGATKVAKSHYLDSGKPERRRDSTEVIAVGCAVQTLKISRIQSRRLRQERKDAAAVVVDDHDLHIEIAVAKPYESRNIMEKGQVAHDHGRRLPVHGHADRRRGHAIDAVGAAVGIHRNVRTPGAAARRWPVRCSAASRARPPRCAAANECRAIRARGAD